jgi:hypothetical protein
MTNRPTSRLIQGHFDALRARRTPGSNTTIDIAAGNYGSGKVFSGMAGVSDPTWVGATDVFHIYLDENDSLILDNTSGFPQLSTKIARVEIVSGDVLDVFDERAVVNGLVDGYQVLFDDSNSTIAFGDTVQEALENLDAYIASISSAVANDLTKFVDFDIAGGIMNGLVKLNHVDDTATLAFAKQDNSIARTRYTISLPNDYVSGTDIVFKLFWSPKDADAGDVRWRISYRTLESGIDNVNSALSTVALNQSTPGIADRLIDTGSNLYIPFSDVGSANILIINVERENNISDTYDAAAHLHLVRMEYTGRGVS